jgi:very-short-patch-repair endonuclease
MPSDELGVRRTYLADGTYTGAGRNENEAKALVGALLERLRATAPGARSFGVVTFGLAQQSLVEDLLDEARGADPAVEAHFADALPEPVFVKNLENVQGDERDEILFSTTYGPGERRVTRQNFGALSRSGGARRLNVAITRARRKLHVFTSMRAADIVVTDAKSDGVRDLEAFLRYLERGAVLEATGASASDQFDSDFEREVYDELRALGHEVHTQVGVGAYRIDLGVVDPRVPGRYLLGVECDGAAYHSGATARDRDRLRQEVLEGLGWTLFRVWSTDWWTRKPAVVQRLRAALEEAAKPAPDAMAAAAAAPKPVQDAPSAPASPTAPAPALAPAPAPAPALAPALAPATQAPIPAAPKSVQDASKVAPEAPRRAANASVPPALAATVPASGKPAVAAPPAPGASAPPTAFAPEGPFEGWLVGERRVHRLRFAPHFNERLIRTPDDFFDDRVGGLFLGGLESLLERQGPLRREEAARLVLEASGFKRMSPKWTARVDVLVAASAGRIRAREGFLWAGAFAHAEHAWVRLGVDGEARDLESVPREELATAAVVVLAGQGAMPLEDLGEEVAKLFGHARPRGETLTRAAAGIELARTRQLLELDGRRALLAAAAERAR